MANIVKTNAGTWRARASITVNGKRKQPSKQGFKTKREAQLWVSRIESESVETAQKKYSEMLLSEYFENWVSVYKENLELATVYQYQNTLDNIIKYLPKARLLDFTRSDFQNFINEFGETHSKETVAKRKNHISQCLKDAYSDGIIDKDPTVRIQLTGNSGKSSSDKFLEDDELAKLDHYTKKKLEQYPHASSYLAIYIAIHTGMRVGEIMALTADDIDFENKTISVNKALDQFHNVKSTKTESSNRVITVDDSLLDELKGITGSVADVSNYGVSKTLKKAIKFLGIKDISFHALRHSHGSLLLSKGVDLKYVSKRLGHKNISTTIDIYTHLLDSQRKAEDEKALNIMSSFFD
ncbi:tyrosine-type recombinase/integrase [Fructobacillus tropaeoli]|uniref:tyrosine-type recombinase/integrase n=1 Tax=Fructobacillus tropaeoli TaxID=709323 RepID=UPI001944D0C3|nr:tyrosine-type recombinase/integrase [Fructobacillus tropaeoli]GIC70572.1 tyrosine-type recombinase/integrase [Fructobacillus tropaeoli]